MKVANSEVALSPMPNKLKSIKIVNEDPERKIIIVSAPGKRSKDDIKTTDLLIRLYEKVLNGINYQDKKKEIIQRYADIVEDLKMDDEILTTIDETLELYISQLSDKPSRLYDALVSCGEDFNAQLIANYNNNQGIPTRYISPKEAGLIVTDLPQQAQILDSSYEHIYKLRDYKENLLFQVSSVFLNKMTLLHFLEEVLILQVQLLLEV